MSWKRIDEVFKKKDYDISVGSETVTIRKGSDLYNELLRTNRRFDLYLDDEEKKIAFVPISDGHYTFVVSDGTFYHRMTTWAGRVISNTLVKGKYKSERGNIDGKMAYVFGGE